MKALLDTLATDYGLSQQQIADLAGVHFSLVSHVRSGKRLLPDKAIAQLTKVMQALQQSQKARALKKRPGKILWQQRLEHVYQQQLVCRVQIRQLESAIRRLQQQENSCVKLAALLRQLDGHAGDKPDHRFERWRNEARYRNEKKISRQEHDLPWELDFKYQAVQVLLAHYEQQADVIKNQINKP